MEVLVNGSATLATGLLVGIDFGAHLSRSGKAMTPIIRESMHMAVWPTCRGTLA